MKAQISTQYLFTTLCDDTSKMWQSPPFLNHFRHFEFTINTSNAYFYIKSFDSGPENMLDVQLKDEDSNYGM